MEGEELHRWLDRLGRPYTQLAPLLGLSINGLDKQMRGERTVSRLDRNAARTTGKREGSTLRARPPRRVPQSAF